MRRATLATSLTLALIALPAATASAATITPNVFGDDFTNNSICSLREAVSIANADSNATEPDCQIDGTLGDDQINLHMEGHDYKLEITGGGNDTNTMGDLDVDTSGGDLRIDGLGASLTTIDTDDTPGWDDRVLDLIAGSGTLEVMFLTVTGGGPSGVSGGGVHSDAGNLVLQFARVTGNETISSGGGVHAQTGTSSLSVLDSLVDGNTEGSLGGGGLLSQATTTTVDSSVIAGNRSASAAGGRGGGMLASAAGGTVTITDSVIAGNVAESTGAPGPSAGGLDLQTGTSTTIRGTTISGNQVVGGNARTAGGLRVVGAGATLKLVNSTVSGNEALGAVGNTGGLSVFNGAAATVVHTTFGPNPAAGPPSAIGQVAGTLNIRGSVVETAGATNACLGAITSQGFNVFTDASCAPLGTGDEASADPMLGALADNGGPEAGPSDITSPILTHLPAAASTVIDHVPAADCDDELLAPLLLDQRGETRPFESDGDGLAECEAGSVESHVAPPAPQGGGGSTPVTPAPAPAKKCKKGQKLKKGKCVKRKKKK